MLFTRIMHLLRVHGDDEDAVTSVGYDSAQRVDEEY